MASVLLPPTMTGMEAHASDPSAELEALITEARSRARRRRFAIAVALIALAGGGIALGFVLSGSSSGRNSNPGQQPLAVTQTLKLDLAGFGTPLPTALNRGPCPNGRTRITISAGRARIGALTECVLTIQKWDAPNWGVKKIVATTRDAYALRGGTIVTRERHVYRFARDQIHSSASFRGEIVGGSGLYAHARGSLVGGGGGVHEHADWKLNLHLTR
jgi:hypothetical protein